MKHSAGAYTEPEVDEILPVEAEIESEVVEEADEELPRPPGRPRGDGLPAGSDRTDWKVPRPPRSTFKSISPHRNTQSAAGWKWWNSLPPWAKEKIDGYVYRDLPVLLEPPRNPDGSPSYYKNIGIIPGDQPIQDDLDLLHRFGCGSYHVILSETGSTRREDRGKDKALCTIWVMNVGGGDYRSNPPTDDHVNDIEKLDKGIPANASYISYLKGAGKWPGTDAATKDREEDMANVQVIEKLMEKNEALTREVIDTSKAQAKDRDKDKIPTERANELAMELVADGAKRNAEMLQSTFDKMLTDARGSGGADPMVMALKIAELITTAKGSGGSNAEVEQLRNQLAQLQRDEVTELRTQVRTLMEAKVTQPAVSASPFAAMKEGLGALDEMSSLLDKLRPATVDANPIEDVAEEAAPKWMKPFIPHIPTILGIAQGFLNMRAQPQPTPGYPAQQQPPQQYGYPPSGYPPQAQYQPARPAGPALVAPPPPAIPLPEPVIQLLSYVGPKMELALQLNTPGSDFADWFIRNPELGKVVYDEVVQMGPEQIMAAMRIHPATTALATHNPDLPEFIAEFCEPLPADEGQPMGA